MDFDPGLGGAVAALFNHRLLPAHLRQVQPLLPLHVFLVLFQLLVLLQPHSVHLLLRVPLHVPQNHLRLRLLPLLREVLLDDLQPDLLEARLAPVPRSLQQSKSPLLLALRC